MSEPRDRVGRPGRIVVGLAQEGQDSQYGVQLAEHDPQVSEAMHGRYASA
ncbi:hypothetical protein AB0M44_08405 [Streptosporangium subroseum]